MNTTQRWFAFLGLALALMVAGACANQMEPAKKAIADIEAAITAAGSEAERYIPAEVEAVRSELASLKLKFDQKDYAGVLAAAPALLTRAQGLGSSAAQAAEQARMALQGDWDSLAAKLPAAVEAIESRVNVLARSSKLPAGLDAATLDGVKTGLAEARTRWTAALEAQAAGRLEEAVAAAREAETRVDAALAALGMSSG